MRNEIDLEELRDELDDLKDRKEDDDQDDPLDSREEERLKALIELDDEINLDSIIRNGDRPIAERDWLDYATETMDNCFSIPKELENYIDYKSFADDLRHDYSEFEWEGTTYLYRSY